MFTNYPLHFLKIPRRAAQGVQNKKKSKMTAAHGLPKIAKLLPVVHEQLRKQNFFETS